MPDREVAQIKLRWPPVQHDLLCVCANGGLRELPVTDSALLPYFVHICGTSSMRGMEKSVKIMP